VIFLLLQRMIHMHTHIRRIEAAAMSVAMVQSAQVQGIPDEQIAEGMQAGMQAAKELMVFAEIAERERPKGLRALWTRITRRKVAMPD